MMPYAAARGPAVLRAGTGHRRAADLSEESKQIIDKNPRESIMMTRKNAKLTPIVVRVAHFAE
jgi:hypothetical protein